MSAVKMWRYTSGRVLGGWGPLLCVLLGSLVAILMPLVGVENQCCAALKGMAQLRCQLWGSSQQPPAVQSTSLTVPFTALDLLPQRSKPSKGTKSSTQCHMLDQIHAQCRINKGPHDGLWMSVLNSVVF